MYDCKTYVGNLINPLSAMGKEVRSKEHILEVSLVSNLLDQFYNIAYSGL